MLRACDFSWVFPEIYEVRTHAVLYLKIHLSPLLSIKLLHVRLWHKLGRYSIVWLKKVWCRTASVAHPHEIFDLIQSDGSFAEKLSVYVKNLVQNVFKVVCLWAVNNFDLSFLLCQLLLQFPKLVEIVIRIHLRLYASVVFVVFQNVVYHVAKDSWFLN